MALPGFNRENRRQNFSYERLPKDAYVLKIIDAKEGTSKKGKPQLVIGFDVAEGEHKDFYMNQYKQDSREDKKWPMDGMFYLTIPTANCEPYVKTSWDSFFADLEDSNTNYRFGGTAAELRGKLIGGKMRMEQQTASNGNVYEHTKLQWTCVAQDVRDGKAGKLPNDRIVNSGASQGGEYGASGQQTPGSFVNVEEGIDDELPFL